MSAVLRDSVAKEEKSEVTVSCATQVLVRVVLTVSSSPTVGMSKVLYCVALLFLLS